MPVSIPTIRTIRDQILSHIEIATGRSAPRTPRSFIFAFATALAGTIHLAYRFGRWAHAQIFTSTMDASSLVLRGREYGIQRTEARGWRGTATATGDDGATISAGEIAERNGVAYSIQASVTIDGSTQVTLEAQLDPEDPEGAASDLSVGDELEFIRPIPGVDGTLTVATVELDGRDREDSEDYRARIEARQQLQPQGSAIPDYILRALEVAGIAEAYVTRPEALVVNVYPLTDDEPEDRIPDASKLTEVENHLTAEEWRPFGGSVNALAFTELDFDIDVSAVSPNNAQTRDTVEEAFADHLFSRRPKQFEDEVDPRDIVAESDLYRVASEAGVRSITLDLKNAGGGSISSYTLETNELAKVRTVTWP